MQKLTRHKLAKISVLMVLSLVLGLTFSQFVQADQSVEVNAEIGAKLIFVAAPKNISLSVDPVDQPTNTAAHRLQVKTNAPSYSITAAYGEFAIGEYDLFENGNCKVASEAPDSGEGTGGSFVEIGDEVTILSGESGYTNMERTPVTYKLTVDYTVPFGEGSTTVVYTAAMST